MNFVEKIKELDLSQGSFMVVGSGILHALAIREAGDIDLIVTDEVYERFEKLGWQRDTWGEQTVLKKDVFDLGKYWYGKPLSELITSAQYVDDIPYLSLDAVTAWKKLLGRDKDLQDLALISEYLSRN